MLKIDEKKIEWVNTAKGIGIILVVFGHVWRGVNAKNLLSSSATFHLVDDVVYSFHMPLFFLISGFFVDKSFAKYNSRNLIINKAKTLMYAYFVWSIIQILINILLSNYTNNSTDFWAILQLVYLPIAPFWYLYALFLMYVLYALLIRTNLKVNVLLAFVLYFLPNTEVVLVENVFNFYIYFVLGALLFNSINQYNKQVLSLSLCIPLFLLSFFVYNSFLQIEDIKSYFIPAIVGSIVVFSVSKVFSNISFLARLGKESLVIFLLHIFFTAGTRIFLYNILGISSVTVHVFLGLMLGLLGPIIFIFFYKKCKLKGLFVYPF